MKRLFPCILSVMLAIGFMPAFALAEQEAYPVPSPSSLTSAPLIAGTLATSALPEELPEARPEAVRGATAPEDEAIREKVYVEDYRDKVPAGYYGTAEESARTDDAAVIEVAMAAAEGKTLVFEAEKTYKFGNYVRSNARDGIWGRSQGIHLKTSNVVIEGNGATIEWDDPQVFVGNDGLVLEGTKEKPIHDIVIRNLNFSAVNNSRDWDDPVSNKTFKNHNLVQLKGLYCENILVDHCTFTAGPNPNAELHAKSDAEGRGISNIWFYGGSKDITVQNCTLTDVTYGSQESGSNLLFSGHCDWYRDQDAESMNRYNSMTPEERYRFLCDGHLQRSVENILVQNNTFEHACHDESVSLWCAELFKDVLIQDNTFNIHDGDAHVPSTVNFTFGQPADHDRIENVIFTRNVVYGEATRDLLASRADMGGDLHVTDNDLKFKRIKLYRERRPGSDGVYVYNDQKQDVASTNGVVYAGPNRDYVDFSGNTVTYDNDDGLGLAYLMGAENLLCENNTFTANGPLQYLTCLYAAEAEGAAGRKSVFTNNTFDINGPLSKALLRGDFHFADNTVNLNGTMSGSSLFMIFGNIASKTEGGATVKENVPYVLSDDLTISGNKIALNTALPSRTAGLHISDASFAGHALDFTDNTFESTVDQASSDWPLVYAQDVLGETPLVDATGTTSSQGAASEAGDANAGDATGELFNMLYFYRLKEGDENFDLFGGALTHAKVLYGHQELTATGDRLTKHPLSIEGLSWDEATYTWAADNATCEAFRMCSGDPSRVMRETADAAPEITRAATCTQPGETT